MPAKVEKDAKPAKKRGRNKLDIGD